MFLGNVTLADVVLGQIRGRAVAPSRGFARNAAAQNKVAAE